jgi:hypothetical protein
MGKSREFESTFFPSETPEGLLVAVVSASRELDASE